MVKIIKTLLYLVSFAYATIGAAQTTDTSAMTAWISNSQVELGKHINLTLIAPATVHSKKLDRLDTIDLSKLKSLFHIDALSEVVFEAGKQSWKIRLTPYNKGILTIPGLTFNGFVSDPIEVTVTEAIDPKSNQALTFSYSISKLTPWVREQVLVIYKLSSSLKLYDLSLIESGLTKTIMHNLDIKETMVHINGSDLYQYQAGYALFNLTDGEQIINLPPLVLKRDGTTTHHFYPPPFKLNVEALPLYLPATVPVGHLSLKTDSPFQFSLTHRLTNTGVTLKGQQMPFSSLPDIGNQFISSDSLQTYPAAQKEIKTSDINGITSKILYTLPVKPTSQGLHTIKPVRLLNFDPARGTLQSTDYTLPTFFSLNIWVSMILILLISLFSLFIIHRFYTYLRLQIKRYRHYKLALKHLSIAKDKQSIRTAIRLICEAEGESSNLTPQQWLKLYATQSEATNLKEPLNQLFYLPSDNQSIPALTQLLVQIIKNKHALIY